MIKTQFIIVVQAGESRRVMSKKVNMPYVLRPEDQIEIDVRQDRYQHSVVSSTYFEITNLTLKVFLRSIDCNSVPEMADTVSLLDLVGWHMW